MFGTLVAIITVDNGVIFEIRESKDKNFEGQEFTGFYVFVPGRPAMETRRATLNLAIQSALMWAPAEAMVTIV